MFAPLCLAQTFPLAELAPGQTGYAITAGPGNVLERFDIEILGVQQDVGLGFPLILVKASGSFIDASGGVAAGMSGSPVYLPKDGADALVGAIGYVFPSSDHSLALVTPIKAMQGEAAEGSEFGATAFARYGVRLDAAVPVRTPLLLSGLSARAGAQLESLFGDTPLDLLPVQLGGAGGFDEDSFALQPGSAVSVQLVRGDITVAAVGTLTQLEDNELLAFGHPLLGEGSVSFALAPAFVSYIVPSDVVPFKLANNGQRVLGSILQDRPAAIRGELGLEPDFLPVTLTLESGQERLTKRLEITDDERYYAPLLGAATLQLFDEMRGEVGAGTAELSWEITLKDGEVVRVLEQLSDANDLVSATARLAAAPLGILAENIFQAPEVAGVTLDITFEAEQRYAEIIEVSSNRETANPGDTVQLNLRLQPYRQAPVVETVSVTLPENAEDDLVITVRGGLEPGGGDEGEDDPILSFAELLVVLNDQVQSSELIIETFVEEETVRLERLSFPYLIRGEETLDLSVETPEDDDVGEDKIDPESLEDAPEDPPQEDLPDEPGPPIEPSLLDR